MKFLKNLLISFLLFVLSSLIINAQDEYCTEPFNPIVICYTPDTDFIQSAYGLSSLVSVYDCALSILSQQCFRYMPLPGFVGTDVVTVYATDHRDDFQTTITVHVSDECDKILNINDASSPFIVEDLQISQSYDQQFVIIKNNKERKKIIRNF